MPRSSILGLGMAAGLVLTPVVLFAADKPTDPQIAHIAYTAGDLDIKAAQQALQKSKDTNVRAFANDMVKDHTAVNDKALALVKKLNVTPEDNDTSKGLVKNADAKRSELAKLSGAAFDKAYVDNEVAYHKTVDDALATTLIPSSQNGELKSFCSRPVSRYSKAMSSMPSISPASSTNGAADAHHSTLCGSRAHVGRAGHALRSRRGRAGHDQRSRVFACGSAREGGRHDRVGERRLRRSHSDRQSRSLGHCHPRR